MKATSILLCFFVMLVSGSCSSDLDFNQAEDIELQPVVVANLASFEVTANQLFINTSTLTTTTETAFTALSDPFLKKNLVQIDIEYELENTINRGFLLQLFFFNASGVSDLPPIQIGVPPSATHPVKFSNFYIGNELSLLKQVQKIRYVVTLLPGPALTPSSTGNLKLRSKATAYFTIQ